MQDNHEMMELNEHQTDAEIMRTIRYLDPDLCPEEAEDRSEEHTSELQSP